MMRHFTVTQRLAVLLTGLYLAGISIYAGVAWWLFTTQNMDVPSPLLYQEAIRHTGEREIVQRGIPYMSGVYSHVENRFDWLMFGVFSVGGVVAIWVLLPGIAWVVRGIKEARAADSGKASDVADIH